MKCKFFLSAALIAISAFSTAQFASRTFAITGKANNVFFWADIKQVDIATGKVSKTLFEADRTSFKIGSTDKSAVAARSINENPTGLGVAACAFDTRHNRLYFATMHFSDILFLDLDKPDAHFTTVKRNVIAATSGTGYQSEENHITRMVIAADGQGYALSNDANHLIRFTTGKTPVVEDLGNLIDAESNNGISIHNKCTSWGGDMIADAFGKLVVVSANHNVFTVDVNSRVATLAGNISGLPVNFTTNGAAVDDDGNLVVCSANVIEGLYKVNSKSLAAEKIKSSAPAFNASDLANGNLLSQKEADDLSRFNIIKPIVSDLSADAKVYPNPLSGNQFNVSFEGQVAGKYTIVFTDITGKALQSKVVHIAKSGQVEAFHFESKNARGIYLVNVLSGERQLAFSEKLIVN